MCLGFSFPLMAGEMDLSVESIACLSSLFGAYLISELPWASGLKFNPVIALILAIILALLLGLLNGILVVKFRINSFMLTLGTLIAYRGLAVYLTGGYVIYNLPREYLVFGRPRILGIPVSAVLFVILAIIFHIILTHTRFGVHVLLVGDNEEAALATGINVHRVRILCYLISAFTAAISGLALTGRIESVGVDLAEGYVFKAFAATVIGGVSLKGGIGKISGVVGGAFLIPLITTGLVLCGFSAKTLDFATGLIIVIALIIDILKGKLVRISK